MGIRFIETNLVGEGWLTRVCDGETPVGHIRQNPRTGSFRYFRGLENKLTVALEHESLASLKRALVCSQLGM